MGQISEINKKMRKYRKLLADFCLLFMSKIEKIMFKKRLNFSTPQPLQHPIFTHTYTLHKITPDDYKTHPQPLDNYDALSPRKPCIKTTPDNYEMHLQPLNEHNPLSF